MRYFESDFRDAARNLAIEEYLFGRVSGEILMVWQNEPCVIIGKNQYASREADLELAKSLSIPLLRRQTGGGAVYQDMGNVNFSYMTDSTGNETEAFLPNLMEAITGLGAAPEFNGRNDLLINGFKISGSAAREEKGRTIYHCTMLVSADIGRMESLLTPDAAKLARNGVKSVGARVKNLADFIPGVSTAVVIDAVKRACACEEKIELPLEAEDEIKAIMAEKYSNPQWNYSLL